MPAVDTLKPTTDDFAAMLEESFAGTAMMEGRVVPATVTAVGSDFVTVDVGLQTEGRIPAKEFYQDEEIRRRVGVGTAFMTAPIGGVGCR